MAQYDSQNIVEIMCNSACKPAKGFDLLRLAELGLQIAPLFLRLLAFQNFLAQRLFYLGASAVEHGDKVVRAAALDGSPEIDVDSHTEGNRKEVIAQQPP